MRLEHGLNIQRVPQVVAIADDVHTDLDPVLATEGLEVRRIKNTKDPAELIAALQGVDIAVTRTSSVFSADVLNGTELSLIQAACKGPHVDMNTARNQGTEVLKVDSNRTQVGNLVEACLSSAATGIAFSNNMGRRNKWGKVQTGTRIFDPARQVFGVYGYGDVGQAVAMRVKPNVREVIAYNHRHDTGRAYDDHIRGHAEGAGVQMVSEDEFWNRVDIASLHIDGTDALGRSNKGAISPETLARMKNRSQPGLGVFINAARGDVAPSLVDLDKMLREGTLHSAFVDVHPTEMEKAGGFAMPEDAHPALNVSHHIAGSGEHVSVRTAQDVLASIRRFQSHGDFMGNSRLYPHQRLDGSELQSEGGLLVRVTRSTEAGSSAATSQAIRSAGLEEIGSLALPDRIPGTRDGVWKHVPHLLCVNGITDLERNVGDLARALDAINETNPGMIVAARFIPNNAEQAAVLRNMQR